MKGFTNNRTLIAFGLALFMVVALWLAVPLTAWSFENSWTLDSDGNEEDEFTSGDDVTVVVNMTKNTEDILRGTSIELDVPNSATNVDVVASYCELYDDEGTLLETLTFDDDGNYDSIDYGYGYDYGYNYFGYGYGYWYGDEYSGLNTYILCYYEVDGSDNEEDGTYTYTVYLGAGLDPNRAALEEEAGTYTVGASTEGGSTGGGGAPIGQTGNVPDDTFEIPIECDDSKALGDVYIDYTGSMLEELIDETTIRIELTTTGTVPGGFEFTTTIDDVNCEDVNSISPSAASMEEGSCIINWELDGDETITFKVRGSRVHKTDIEYSASACIDGQEGEEGIPTIPETEENPEGTVQCTQDGNTVRCLVTDENGNPISGEEVTVIGPDGTVYTYTTDENGNFSFLASEAGRWAYTFKNYDASGSLMVSKTGEPIDGETGSQEGDSSGLLLIGGVVIIVLAIILWWLNSQGALGLKKLKKK
ncbi:MAG: carboxypeptidase-like regulatory domain-containing protein [Candidatus Micrarchaeia archaeon]